MPEFTGHNDIRNYLRVLWRWKWLFLTFVIAGPVIAFLLASGKPKVYSSSALIGVNQASVNSAPSGGGSFTTNNVTAIADLVTTTPVAQIAGQLMTPPASPGEIAGEVSASGDPSTNFITITAQDRDPARAAAIANAFAKAIGVNRADAQLAAINSSIAGTQAQLNRTSDAATRAQLQQQLSALRGQKASPGGEAALLQAAEPAGAPTGTSLRRSIELGLIIGILLGFGAVVLAENSDRRIRTPEDLERMTGMPLLASIPPTAFSGSLDTTPEDDEAFHMLRTALRYFNADETLHSIMITSPGEQDGKTTVATRLALSAATAGMNVVIVDGDLRRTQVSEKLGLRVKGGLGAVLAGMNNLSDELVDFPLGPEATGTLKVLPAGPPPPNPSALIGSAIMVKVLQTLERDYDLVVVDTPAALAVSDPLPLMSLVSGVVLVARMNRSSRGPLNRLNKMIDSADGKLVGVVATGVSSGPGSDSYSPKYYTSHGSSARRRWPFGRKRGGTPPAPPRPDAAAATGPLSPEPDHSAAEPTVNGASSQDTEPTGSRSAS